jgi:hypothetical protein
VCGCSRRSPAEKVLADYWNVAQCADRTAFVLEPEAVRPYLEREYKASTTCNDNKDPITAKSCDQTPVGEYCEGSVGKHSYCIKRVTQDEYKIDWPCSTGFNEAPFAVITTRPAVGEMHVQRVTVSLSSSYFIHDAPFDKSETTMALDLSDRSGRPVYAYTPRDAAAGKRLAELLADGKSHALTLVLGQWSADKLDVFYAMAVASEDWRSLSVNETAAAKKNAAIAAEQLLQPGKKEAEAMKQCADALAKRADAARSKYGGALYVALSSAQHLLTNNNAGEAYRGTLGVIREVLAKSGAEVPSECLAISQG